MFKGYHGLEEEMDTILKEVLRIEHKRDWLDLTMGFHAFVVFGALNSLITRKFYFCTDIDKVRNLLKIYFLLYSLWERRGEKGAYIRIWDACRHNLSVKQYFKCLFFRFDLNGRGHTKSSCNPGIFPSIKDIP